MKKKLLGITLSASVAAAMLAGCGEVNVNVNAPGLNEALSQVEESAGEASDENTDLEAANNVAALIDAIYVQEWTEDTEEKCKAAKEAWDALTDKQKELVEGEFADPDYFGRDTGDASLDDPLNQDEIGENEILVVSFGTSFNESRAEDIGGIEKAIAKANPDWSVRRAFTAQIIMNHVLARDNKKIDNMKQALDRAVDNGVKNLVVQPTHLMHGAEYNEMVDALKEYVSDFESIKVAEPLLGEVGKDASEINEDKKAVAGLVAAKAAEVAGYDDIEAAAQDNAAIVLMGHGTSHNAKVTYDQMQTQMEDLGYKNVFIGTVEGEPEDTACDVVIDKVADAGYKKVILRPLMVVAGDHANNDMAGDEDDSWKSMFGASGSFDSVECQIEGLGRIEGVQELYVSHTQAAFDSESLMAEATEDADNNDKDTADKTTSENEAEDAETASEASATASLEDGTYEAVFTTDSSMFHVNEALNDMGDLTVKDGKMTIHVSLAGDGIINLFPGTAEDAAKDGAKLLEPTEDEITYDDGTKEVVNGFDIPVPSLDEPFKLAIIGKKGVWYDHEVSVSLPEEE